MSCFRDMRTFEVDTIYYDKCEALEADDIRPSERRIIINLGSLLSHGHVKERVHSDPTIPAALGHACVPS
jgi:hypothetical protein